MSRVFPVDDTRRALRDLKMKTAEIGSEAPTWDRVLTVREHEGALDPSRPIVIGDRGTGKSFWTGTLFDPEKRKRLSTIYSRLNLQNVDVAIGYGADEFTAEHPVASELKSLLSGGADAETIWRTVILNLLPQAIRPIEMTRKATWPEKVAWVSEDPALRRADFLAADRQLSAAGQRFLVVFDALDTMASRW